MSTQHGTESVGNTQRDAYGRNPRKQGRREHQQDFSNDLLLEIISRLEVKKAMQCKCLNKDLYNLICHPSFSPKKPPKPTNLLQFSSLCPKYYSNVALNPPHAFGSCLEAPVEVRVMASCNGLLLLYFNHKKEYCVVNPVIETHQSITPPRFFFDYQSKFVTSQGGLAVDLDTFSSPRYKVVIVRESREQHFLVPYEFNIFSPERNTWKKSSPAVEHKYSAFKKFQPIYLHKCLHWLRQCGDILCFNVEKEVANIIQKLPYIGYSNSKWFGISKGVITVVSAIGDETIISELYDYAMQKWRICARISNLVSPKEIYLHQTPVFFDGERLILLLITVEREKDIVLYNMGTKLWEKIAKIPSFMNNDQLFVPFVCTPAKVSNVKYVAEEDDHEGEVEGHREGVQEEEEGEGECFQKAIARTIDMFCKLVKGPIALES